MKKPNAPARAGYRQMKTTRNGEQAKEKKGDTKTPGKGPWGGWGGWGGKKKGGEARGPQKKGLRRGTVGAPDTRWGKGEAKAKKKEVPGLKSK